MLKMKSPARYIALKQWIETCDKMLIQMKQKQKLDDDHASDSANLEYAGSEDEVSEEFV